MVANSLNKFLTNIGKSVQSSKSSAEHHDECEPQHERAVEHEPCTDQHETAVECEPSTDQYEITEPHTDQLLTSVSHLLTN